MTARAFHLVVRVRALRAFPRCNASLTPDGPMVPLDLSYDHRVIYGAEAARFLAHGARLIAEPRNLQI